MNRDRTVLAAVLVVALTAAVIGAVVGGFPDLHVYRYGGRSVLDQVPGYESDDPVTGYPLTYPPFAALGMVPLALLPGWLAAGLWTGFSAGCLAGVVVLVCREIELPATAWLVVPIATASLALEPVWQNYSFGQINLILMLAVLLDVTRPERRTSGLLLGIAAAVKLTPLVFVVLLVLVGQRGAAARASLTFVGTVLVGLTVMPGASSYWTDGLVDPKRVGPPQLAHNQSLAGALTRLLGEPPPTALWLAVAGPVALATVFVAARWWRRGDRVLATCLGAMAMLLASPVSWSHHWVWAVPVALVLWERLRWAAVVWAAVFVTRPILWPPWGERHEFEWRWFEHVYGNAYLLAALALCVGAGIALAKARTEPLATPDRV